MKAHFENIRNYQKAISVLNEKKLSCKFTPEERKAFQEEINDYKSAIKYLEPKTERFIKKQRRKVQLMLHFYYFKFMSWDMALSEMENETNQKSNNTADAYRKEIERAFMRPWEYSK